MPQQASDEPITRLNLHLPQSLRRRLDRHLFDHNEQRVPKGRYQDLIVRLLKGYLVKQESK